MWSAKNCFKVFNNRVFPVALVLLIGLMTGCQDNSVSSGIIEDIAKPVIDLDGVSEGDTLTISYSYLGNFLDIKVLDETGLQAYHVEISEGQNTLIDVTNEALGTVSEYSLDLSDLNPNVLYQVLVSVTDAAENEDSMQFSLQIFFQEAIVDYDDIFIVGTATSGGYDLSQQSPMTVNPDNPNIFTWTDTLRTGEFKFKTYPEQDFCGGDWIHPIESNQALSATEYSIEEGCAAGNPDYKWNVEVPGIYSITINFLEETITINQDQIIGETFDEIYMVGSASPGGWDLASQTALTQNPQNEFEFNWSGELVAGEFKFKVYAGNDFCGGRWIHPTSQGQALTSTDFELLVGCDADNPDYKWVIGDAEAGNYSIQINMASRTINISAQ